jgi:RNA polymerase sigma-70 factor (ECF subfamily)
MTPEEQTCWTVVRSAAAGNTDDRERFVVTYSPVVKAYLEARWSGTPLAGSLDDGIQDVFLECFKEGGVLDRVDEIRRQSFRGFLYGVVRNVARRFERETARNREEAAEGDFDFDALEREEETFSKIFDRAWARTVLKEAVAIQLDRAAGQGEAAEKRVELLHLRFYEGLPIREIARRWDTDPELLHQQYRQARKEFRAALLEVAEFHNPGSPEDAEREVEEIIAILSG